MSLATTTFDKNDVNFNINDDGVYYALIVVKDGKVVIATISQRPFEEVEEDE